MAMDAFRLLGQGARFEHRPRKSVTKAQSEQNTARDIALDQIPDELDFFKTKNNSQSTTLTNGKKRKRPSGDEQPRTDTDIDMISTPEKAASLGKVHHIKVSGTDVAHPFASFEELIQRFDLAPYLQNNLRNSGFSQPTPIQMQAIPIMCHGRDVIGLAPTGSGKTLAFLIPILRDLKGPMKEGYRAVIVSPTRELAQQIHEQLLRLSHGRKFKICLLTKATSATQAQDPKLREKFDILITTPLRLVNEIKNDHIDLSHVQHLVLDEADRLLDMGFLEQTDEIFAACSNAKLQKALFSATLPSGVEQLAQTVMKDPVRIVIGRKDAATETITQQLVYVGSEEGKLLAMRQLIKSGDGTFSPPILIFVQSIDRARQLFHELVYDGINVDVIHAERTLQQRTAIVESFKKGDIWVLISTELMARGIDFKGVNLVVNYDFPQTVQSYIHRIGRTGRAGRQGRAITYFTKDDSLYLKSIVNVMRQSGCQVPEWMVQLKTPKQEDKRKLKHKPIERKVISTMTNKAKGRKGDIRGIKKSLRTRQVSDKLES